MRINAFWGIIFPLLAVLGAAALVLGPDNAGISGVVTDASGQPAAGAMVRAKNLDKGLATTVISQDRGKYTLPSLLPGKYVVHATGGGLQSETNDPITLSAGQKLTVNLVLSGVRSFREASTAANDMALLPEGDGKRFIQAKCGLCHRMGFQEILLSRKTKDGWMQTLEKMRHHPYGYSGSLDVTDQERDMVVEYLAKNLNPGVPPLDQKENVPKTWVKGPAAKSVIVEFDLPKGAYPHDVDEDSQGALWVSERELGYIGRLDPVTFAYTRYRLPGDKVQLSDAISVDPKGHPWMIDAKNSIVFEFNPETKSFTAFPYKSEDGQGAPGRGISANTIRFLPDGSVWFSEVGASKVGRLDPATKQFAEYSPPSFPKTGPYGMAVDGAGFVWFAEELGNKVGKIDPKTRKITEFDPPTPNSIPRRMGADREGNLWFSEFAAGNLVKIDYRTGTMSEHPTPTRYSAPYGVDSDKLHNFIWVSECHADQMARFDPRTKTWVEYPLPEHYLSVRKISVDPKRPNRVWFGEPFKDRVGYIEVPE